MRLFSTPAAAIAAGCLLLCGGGAAAQAQTSTRATLDIDGGTLAYETCGVGPKAIVLLHDGILHSAAFDDVWPILCQRFGSCATIAGAMAPRLPPRRPMLRPKTWKP